MPLGALENGRVRKPVADAIAARPAAGGAVLRGPVAPPVQSSLPTFMQPQPGGAWSPGTGTMPPRPNPSAGTVGPSGRAIAVSSGPMRPPAGRTLPPGATLSPDGNDTGYFDSGGTFRSWPAPTSVTGLAGNIIGNSGQRIASEVGGAPGGMSEEDWQFFLETGSIPSGDINSWEAGRGNPIQPMGDDGVTFPAGPPGTGPASTLPGGTAPNRNTPPPPPSITGTRQQTTDASGTAWQWEPGGANGGRWVQVTPVGQQPGGMPGPGWDYDSTNDPDFNPLRPQDPIGGNNNPIAPAGGGGQITPTSGGYPPIIIGPSGGGGTGGGHASRSESTYSYDKPIHTFDPAEAQNYAPALGRENVDGLKFTDLLAREGNNGLPFNEMIAREQAPDQQYGKQQALEAANEANALLAQGLKRRHQDIAGQLGSRGMGEGGAAARIGDLATSETLGQQAGNIRSALENAAKYGDERSLNIFGQQIGQRGQDVTQQSQLNNAILELLGQGVQQRGQDVSMANEINQGGLAMNNQRIAQRGQDVDQQKAVAQIIQSLLGQNQKEMWSNSQGSSSGGGNQGWATEAGLGNIMGRVYNML